MGQRYEKSKKNVSENKKTLERLHSDKDTLQNEYAPLSLLDSIQGLLDDEATDAIQGVRAVGELESQRIESETGAAEEGKKQITGEINSEIAKLNAGLEKLRRSGDIEFGKKAVEQSSQEYKKQIDKFKSLIEELGETTASANASCEGGAAPATMVDSFTVGDENTEQLEDNKPKTLHLSRDEVNARWQQTVQNIDLQIENYKETLVSRGVPEGTWLNKTLAEHRARMLEQEGYNLDVASGHASDTVHSPNAYSYPGDYSSFYDNLAIEFRDYCLDGTNPNYSTGPEWKNNCQRCVPTYELRRRGVDATVYPSTHGSEHLSHYPFDVWEMPQILSGSGTGKTDIEQAMSSWGDGARAQVVVIWDDGFGTSGHTFIAEQRNGTTHFLDPQTNNSDVSSYFDDVLPGRTQFCRIDNLNTSSFINDCYEQEDI